MMLCFEYNINKLRSKIQNNQCGMHLYELKFIKRLILGCDLEHVDEVNVNN